ncbi:MAG: acyl-CoA dehydrogenase family protein, partial [Candidatus Limnocylindria bacterium]
MGPRERRRGYAHAVDRPGILAAAHRVADEVLFPAAIRTDSSALVPLESLDALAEAGLYGIVGPPEAGGLGADFGTLCDVVEILAGACLATAFIWVQHHSAVRAVAATETPGLAARFLEPLCRGRLRAGVAL